MKKNLITYQRLNSPFQITVYADLKALCDDKGYSYEWLRKQPTPFLYDSHRIDRISKVSGSNVSKWA